jgi:signal transduction histidine kinase
VSGTPNPDLRALADAADRADRLQRVTDRLAEALAPQEVLDAILTEGLRAAEARAGAIGVLTEDEGGSVEIRRGVGGTGLGLYICHELVERMQGRLEVDSEPGKGSRFTVALPVDG